jgi:ankyrin repeat protein
MLAKKKQGCSKAHYYKNKDNLARWLHEVVQHGDLDGVIWLVERGADVNAKNEAGTPLQEAAKDGHLGVAQWLVKNGANIHSKDQFGTPLHGAAGSGHLEFAEWLVELGASVDARDDLGRTPLHKAAEGAHYALVEWLVEQLKTDVNMRDDRGYTALHCAVDIKSLKIVQLLILNKANVRTKNLRNETPLDMAISAFAPDMRDIMAVLVSATQNIITKTSRPKKIARSKEVKTPVVVKVIKKKSRRR